MQLNQPDGDSQRPVLPANRLQELGSVAQNYLAERITDDELERVVMAVSRDARERGMKAEELIVACKEVWRTLPSDGTVTERSTRARKLERLVQICIDGYFGDD